MSGLRERRMWRLYSLIGVENGVATPDGLGTLRQAFSDRCLVSVGREKRRVKLRTGGNLNQCASTRLATLGLLDDRKRPANTV